jgi:uncharacterized protein
MPVYLDSSVLLIAAGAPHPRRAACLQLVTQALDGHWRVHVSVETIQEFVFHRIRRGDAVIGIGQARHLAEAFIVHVFDHHVLTEALRLMEVSPVRGRDAVHAATALLAGFDRIVTLDSDFGAVPGLSPVTPEEMLHESAR